MKFVVKFDKLKAPRVVIPPNRVKPDKKKKQRVDACRGKYLG